MLFLIFVILIIPQSTTQGSRQKNIVKLQHHEQNDIILTKKNISSKLFFCQIVALLTFFGRNTKSALQFREGRDKGTRLNVSCSFFWFLNFFFLGKFFIFFVWEWFFYRCLPSVSLGPWFESQALPDLWSPRVWFTFRNLKFFFFSNWAWPQNQLSHALWR